MEEPGYYKQLPYRLVITQDPETKLYHAEYPDLPGCSVTAVTVSKAIKEAEARKAERLSQHYSGNEGMADSPQFYITHDHDPIDRFVTDRKPLRVAAYLRESVRNNGLRSPLELQQKLFETQISGHPGWVFAGNYVDKGEAQMLKNRPGLLALLAECEIGNIDVVICRNMSRLFKYIPDVIKLIQRLRQLDPPVGVYFEQEDTFSLSTETL